MLASDLAEGARDRTQRALLTGRCVQEDDDVAKDGSAADSSTTGSDCIT